MDSINNHVKRLEEKAKLRRTQGDAMDQLPLPIEELLPMDITNGSQPYPTHFTRIPVFAPIKERKVADTDWSTGETYDTKWGRITRYGPGLDMYDEDTLLGLLGTAQEKRLRGLRQAFPVPLEAVNGTDSTIVHYGHTSAYAVNQYLGRGLGGKDLKKCRDSIRRIALTQFVIYRKDLAIEGKVHLFDYKAENDFRGTFDIQFSPVMVRLLKEYTYIDMNVRSKLSDLGKALHKFLSSQPNTYKIRLDKLKTTLGYRGQLKHFHPNLKKALNELSRKEWIKEWSITGTGRRIPHVLHISK
jgi:hypothetical protein